MPAMCPITVLRYHRDKHIARRPSLSTARTRRPGRRGEERWVWLLTAWLPRHDGR
jgi:hypothetical protein